MEKCQRVHIVSTTKQNVYSPTWKRSATLLRGLEPMLTSTCGLCANPGSRAKYIEGLENRLGRMESLLKMSGLLNDDDGDLGSIEKRLADKTNNKSNGGTPVDSPTRRSKSVSQPRSSTESPQTTPRLDKIPTPPDSTKSPDPQKQTEEEVEALSDRMCSLVTNNCGETRYIGRSSIKALCCHTLISARVLVRIFYLLA
jgi:hypothetical protein